MTVVQAAAATRNWGPCTASLEVTLAVSLAGKCGQRQWVAGSVARQTPLLSSVAAGAVVECLRIDSFVGYTLNAMTASGTVVHSSRSDSGSGSLAVNARLLAHQRNRRVGCALPFAPFRSLGSWHVWNRSSCC